MAKPSAAKPLTENQRREAESEQSLKDMIDASNYFIREMRKKQKNGESIELAEFDKAIKASEKLPTHHKNLREMQALVSGEMQRDEPSDEQSYSPLEKHTLGSNGA